MRTAPLMLIVLAALLGAAALGILAFSPDDSRSPAVPELGVPTSAAPVVETPTPLFIDDPETGAVEPLVSEAESTPGFRSQAVVLSTWGSPGEGARAPCTLIVIDDMDRPVSSAAVQVWGDDRPRERGHIRRAKPLPVGPYESITDAAGRCEVRPPPYRPRVVVEKDGVGRSAWVELSPLDEDDQYKVMLVPLAAPARLRGRVVHANGSPAPGIAVSIETESDDDEPVTVTTDSDGRFERDVPGESRVALRAVIPDVKTCPHWFRTRAGRAFDALLWLPGDWALRGRLIHADGTPVRAGAKVEFWPDPLPVDRGRDPWMHDRGSITDASGRFEIPIEQPTSGLLTASGDGIGGLSKAPQVVIDVAHPQLEVTLLACASASIAGRVVDEAGAPVQSPRVWASAEETASEVSWDRPRIEDLHAGAKTKAEADGRFELSPLHPGGLYTVYAQHADSGRVLSVRHVVPGTSDLVLAFGGPMEQDASLALVVSERATGRRVDSFRVMGRRQADAGRWSRAWQETYRGTSGIAVIEHLPKDVAYDILVVSDGFACALVESVMGVIDGTAIEVALEPLMTLDVEITSVGAVAPWAVVEAERHRSSAEDAVHPDHSMRQVRADERGRARLTELEPGRYSMRVVHGGREIERDVDVRSGATERLVIDLP